MNLSYHHSKQPISGFTLYEIVLVLSIISIVSAFALAGYLSWVPAIRLNGAVRQVMGDLMAARMLSVKENSSTVISHVNDHVYAITVGGKPAITKDLHSDYPGASINFSSILISSRGTTTPRTITLKNSSGIKTITVAITGRVKAN
jgi:type IV fimbrial biogenesis protein FimT